MSTTTKVDLVKTIVARIKAYTFGGTSVGALTGNRVYVSQAPDATTYPYVVVRKINSHTDPQYANVKEVFEIEAMCFGRPRSTEQTVELIAELVKQSLLTWVESGATLGLSFARSAQDDTLPPVPDPGDREVVQVRVIVECVSWPRYLTLPLTA